MFEDNLHMDRRRLISGVLASTVVALPTAGCLLLLPLRVFVGRGLAASLRGAARAGRVRSALTFGRGVSIGHRLASAKPSGAVTGQILEHRGKAVATFESSAEISKVIVDGSPVFFSRQTDYGFIHNDFNGPCGRSVYSEDRNTIEHQSDSGILFSVDTIDRERNLVQHFDANGSKTGESLFRINESDVIVSNDKNLIESIDDTTRALGLQCPETKRAYNELLAAQEACSNGNTLICRDIAGLNSKYIYLKNRCT